MLHDMLPSMIGVLKKSALFSLVALCLIALIGSISALAANTSDFSVNNAYFKGGGKYDIVVHDSNKETLQLYINDKDPVKAKVNKDGWATFKKVKLTGQSKLSFAKKVGFMKYTPIDYVKYISVDGEQIKLMDTGPKHSFEEFYKWSTGERYDALMAAVGNAYQQIMASCGSKDRNFGPKWTACMQEGYKEYLKPDTFIDGNWQNDYTTMVGYINDAGSQHALYGDLSVSKSERYQKDMSEAKKIYEILAATN